MTIINIVLPLDFQGTIACYGHLFTQCWCKEDCQVPVSLHSFCICHHPLFLYQYSDDSGYVSGFEPNPTSKWFAPQTMGWNYFETPLKPKKAALGQHPDILAHSLKRDSACASQFSMKCSFFDMSKSTQLPINTLSLTFLQWHSQSQQ